MLQMSIYLGHQLFNGKSAINRNALFRCYMNTNEVWYFQAFPIHWKRFPHANNLIRFMSAKYLSSLPDIFTAICRIHHVIQVCDTKYMKYAERNQIMNTIFTYLWWSLDDLSMPPDLAVKYVDMYHKRVQITTDSLTCYASPDLREVKTLYQDIEGETKWPKFTEYIFKCIVAMNTNVFYRLGLGHIN